MKVLVISSYKNSINSVRPEGELLIGVHQSGIDVTVMTEGDAEFVSQFRAAGMRVIDFHPTKKFDKSAVHRIRDELVLGQYDILHLFNNKAIINGIRAAKALPVKVVTYRGYTGNIHWWDPSNYLTHLHPGVDKITCVSEAVKEVFDKQLFFDNSKAVVVSKGHKPEWYQGINPASLDEFNIPPDHVVISIVANARRMKGMPYLIEASKEFPADLKARFLMIGRGLDHPANLRKLEKLGMRDKFIFAGFRSNVLNLVAACDMAVLPSVKGEGLSKVLLESMYLGKATIMTDIGGNRGLAIDGETGIVVPAKDASALGKAIVQLVNDSDLRARLGVAGKEYIAREYSSERSVRELVKVYNDLVA